MMRMLRTILIALLLVVLGASTAAATHGQPHRAVPSGAPLVGIDAGPDFEAPSA